MASGESKTNVAAAASKKQLGLSHMSHGQNDQALQEFKDALELEIKALGDKHETVAHTKINIASVYQIQGLHDAALQQYVDAQKILKENEASNGRALGVVYLNIGSCQLSRGDFELARNAYNDAIRVKKLEYGENHVEVTAAMCKLQLNLHYYPRAPPPPHSSSSTGPLQICHTDHFGLVVYFSVLSGCQCQGWSRSCTPEFEAIPGGPQVL
jgi:tetratricopeptide (TPR) repeat protein